MTQAVAELPLLALLLGLAEETRVCRAAKGLGAVRRIHLAIGAGFQGFDHGG